MGTKGRWALGPRHRPSPASLETKPERRARETAELKKRITELEHRVVVTQRAARAAVNLLAPYIPDRKPTIMPLRRTFQRAGKV